MSDLREMLLQNTRPEAEAAFREISKSIYLGKNTVLTRMLNGKKFFAFADDVGFSANIMMDGFWEFWLTRFFAELIKPGDTVIDVGANLGYYTVIAGDLGNYILDLA